MSLRTTAASDRVTAGIRLESDWERALPGGSVEIGESVTDAAIREVVRYPDGNVWHYVNVCFECVVRGGTMTTCDETLALRYVAPTRLPRTLLPNHRIRIRDACSRRAAAFVR